MKNSTQPYRALLSFDLEEFDIPNEYGSNLAVSEQLAVTREGMGKLYGLLTELGATSTFFTTAFYAQRDTEFIHMLAADHEIASHSFEHSGFESTHPAHSKLVLESISGKPVTGFRMPRLAKIDQQLLVDAGYTYDSSLNPTWLPGRYNHLSEPRTAFRKNDLWIIPASVTPLMRMPLFWLAFKNLPLPILKFQSLQVLKADGYLSLYFHPWEFADLRIYHNMPLYTRRISGDTMLNKLGEYLGWLKQIAAFQTMNGFVSQLQPQLAQG